MMLDEAWNVASELDTAKKTDTRRAHMLRVLTTEINGGKGIRAQRKPPDPKNKSEKWDSLSWHQGCGMTADKILAGHVALLEWMRGDDANMHKRHVDMWASYATFNALQQKADGVTKEEEIQCGMWGREMYMRVVLVQGERIIPYVHVQVRICS
jgi:hypothetical protein